MSYQKVCNTRNGVLNESFKESVGQKENSDITNSINNVIQTSKDTLYTSIPETLTSKIQTEQSGEARTRLSSTCNYMN